MSETRQQANVMISYLFQVMYERGEQLRKTSSSKEAEQAASIIHSLARSISILREDYGMYDRAPEPQPEPDEQPAPPQTEPAEWDQDMTDAPTETAASEETHE